MPKTSTSFLIRYWRLGGGEHRLELEHIHTGARTRTGSFAAAQAWMDACSGNGNGNAAEDAAGEQPEQPDRPDTAAE